MLGHASAAMTLDVYADLFDDDLDAVAVALDDHVAAEVVGILWAAADDQQEASLEKENPRRTGGFTGGSDRRRSGDLSIFSRTLYQLSYRAEGHGFRRSFATLTGLEPATSAVTGRRANQLRYRALRGELPVGIVTPTGFEPVLPP